VRTQDPLGIVVTMSLDIDSSYLIASLIVSAIGFVLFSYGRSMRRFPHMCIGAVMTAYPYFVTNVPLMLGVVPALLAVLWAMIWLGT
jgi:hypothetical protein